MSLARNLSAVSASLLLCPSDSSAHLGTLQHPSWPAEVPFVGKVNKPALSGGPKLRLHGPRHSFLCHYIVDDRTQVPHNRHNGSASKPVAELSGSGIQPFQRLCPVVVATIDKRSLAHSRQRLTSNIPTSRDRSSSNTISGRSGLVTTSIHDVYSSVHGVRKR